MTVVDVVSLIRARAFACLDGRAVIHSQLEVAQREHNATSVEILTRAADRASAAYDELFTLIDEITRRMKLERAT